jgi:hypothetical protein
MKLSHWARKHGMGYLTAWRWLRADILLRPQAAL